MATNELKIEKVRGWFAVYAGASKLSKGFRSEAAAEADLEKNRAYYEYWAGSASVVYENRIARGEFTTIEAN